MLALIGIIGFAVSAFVFSEADFEVADDATAKDPLEKADDEFITVSELLDASDHSSSHTVTFATDAGDTVAAGAGHDYLHGQDGADVLRGAEGDDELHGGRDDDQLFGGAGDDSLFGHVGDDLMMGEGGDDTMIGGDGQDQLFGGDGDDRMQGYLGDDLLVGGAGADVMFGGAGDDVIDGRDGEVDFLNGGHGDDVLLAGAGDHLHGGEGADAFVFDLSGPSHVADFNPDEDRIELAYDADFAEPFISFSEGDDGVTLIADDTEIAFFAGLTALDMADVQIVYFPN